MNKKTNVLAVCVCAAMLVFSFSFLFSFSETDRITTQVFSTQQNADFSVRIINSTGGLPVENAKIVFPQNGQSCTTDSEGYIKNVSVPVYSSENSMGEISQDWQKTCFIVYADGFIPTLVYDFRIREKDEKIPNIYVMSEEDYSPEEPLVICELPQTSWAQDVIDRFAP